MYKIYTNGLEFLREHKGIFDAYPLDTSFFVVNAKSIDEFSVKKYIFKFYNENSYLLVLYLYPYNLLLYGSEDLCEEAANTLLNYNLEVSSILANDTLVNEFLYYYEQRMGGSHYVSHSMDIMYCTKMPTIDTSMVKRATIAELDTIIDFKIKFYKEALKKDISSEEVFSTVISEYQSYWYIECDNKIVSLAKRTKDEERICCVSAVYTLPEYRNQGFAKKVVSKITQEIINDNKIAYLYVEKTNPISNHVYQEIGYNYGNSKHEVHYLKSSIKTLVLAGGCFWCSSKPYYEYDGVRRVLSGYCGGELINPTYEEVKTDTTGHKESILIEYDSNVISYKELVDIYFTVIDPFDSGGQFIDRGSNYSLAIFSDDLEVVNYVNQIIAEIEKIHNKKCHIAILPNAIFYMAEEYHQDFAINNPDKMNEELNTSGRLNKYFDFNLNVIPGMDILTRYKGKDLLLENVYFYDGPITLQLLPYGGIQSVFGFNLIINCRNGFIKCDTLIYDNKRYITKEFVKKYNDLVNVVLPN